MKDCIVECLEEFLFDNKIILSLDKINELAESIDHGVSMYQEVYYSSIPSYNPLEDKVIRLEKQVENMYSRETVNQMKNQIDVHKREINRLRTLIEDLKSDSKQEVIIKFELKDKNTIENILLGRSERGDHEAMKLLYKHLKGF